MEIFEKSFVELVQNTLDVECPDGSGKAITRTALCQKLGLDKEYEPVIGLMVASNIVEGYESRKGPNGGIGRSGQKATKKKTSLLDKVDSNFLDSLTIVLDYLLKDSADVVTRESIASEMGRPGTENFISAALALPEFSMFESKPGKNGGIRRKQQEASVLEESLQEKPVDEVATV